MLSLLTIAWSLVTLSLPIDTLAGHIRRANGPSAQDSYIVVLKKETNCSAHLSQVSTNFFIADENNSFHVRRQYNRALNGYNAHIKGAAIDMILADPSVDYIVEDSIASISWTGPPRPQPRMVDAFGRRAEAPTNGTDGEGVDIYGIDTGIYLEHNDFGGRAVWGATFGNYSDIDENGHGTHTASIAAGARYGIAKAAHLIAVRVLDKSGNGPYSDIIAGVEWAMNAAAQSGRLSVVNMSVGGPSNDAMDQAVQNAVDSGLHVVVSAGNAGADADATSPARVKDANTIGAVDISNKSASFSNFGPEVDVFALGVSVTAAWIDGPAATQVLSGTSMAAPRVAGILATALGKRGKTTPAELSAALIENAKHVVTGQPSNTTDLLAQSFA
ncbi:putative subtilisin-like serine protease [Serendipita vermifera]|nr:putative subtilisin-like serine protease [Serendipita vermifera]